MNKKNYYIWRNKSCGFCFKELPLDSKQKSQFSYHLTDREILLSVLVGAVDVSADKLSDF